MVAVRLLVLVVMVSLLALPVPAAASRGGCETAEASAEHPHVLDRRGDERYDLSAAYGRNLDLDRAWFSGSGGDVRLHLRVAELSPTANVVEYELEYDDGYAVGISGRNGRYHFWQGRYSEQRATVNRLIESRTLERRWVEGRVDLRTSTFTVALPAASLPRDRVVHVVALKSAAAERVMGDLGVSVGNDDARNAAICHAVVSQEGSRVPDGRSG